MKLLIVIQIFNVFGYENLFAYREQHLVFAEHFIRENGYYSTTHDITWLDDTLSSGRRIKMSNYEGAVSTFLLRATPLPKIYQDLL